MQASVGTFLVGMEWAIALDRSERARIQKLHRLSAHVMVRVGQMRCFGFHGDVAQAGVYSAALVLGQGHPNCMVCLSLSPTLYWFCVIQGTRPLSGLDLLLDEHKAQAHWAQYRQLFAGYEMLCSLSQVQDQKQDEKQDQKLENPLENASVEDFLDAQLEALSPKIRSLLSVQSPLLHQRRRRKIFIATLLICALSAIGLELMTDQFRLDDQAQLRFARERMETLFTKQQLLQGQQKSQEVHGLETALLNKLEAYLFVPDPIELWHVFNDLRRAIPLSREGLRAKGIRCGAERCEVDWSLQGTWHATSDSLAFKAKPLEGQSPSEALNRGVAAEGAGQSHIRDLNGRWPMPSPSTLVMNASGESQSVFPISIPKIAYKSLEINTLEHMQMYMNLELKKIWPMLTLTPMSMRRLVDIKKEESLNKAAPSVNANVNANANAFAKGAPKAAPEGMGHQEIVHIGTWQIQWVGDSALVRAGEFIAGMKGQPLAVESLSYAYREGLILRGTYFVLDLSPDLWRLIARSELTDQVSASRFTGSVMKEGSSEKPDKTIAKNVTTDEREHGALKTK